MSRYPNSPNWGNGASGQHPRLRSPMPLSGDSGFSAAGQYFGPGLGGPQGDMYPRGPPYPYRSPHHGHMGTPRQVQWGSSPTTMCPPRGSPTNMFPPRSTGPYFVSPHLNCPRSSSPCNPDQGGFSRKRTSPAEDYRNKPSKAHCSEASFGNRSYDGGATPDHVMNQYYHPSMVQDPWAKLQPIIQPPLSNTAPSTS